MSGWQLNEGECTLEELTEVEVTRIVQNLLSDNIKRTTSYKYIFFNALLGVLDEVDEVFGVSLEKIYDCFTTEYIKKYSVYRDCFLEVEKRYFPLRSELIDKLADKEIGRWTAEEKLQVRKKRRF